MYLPDRVGSAPLGRHQDVTYRRLDGRMTSVAERHFGDGSSPPARRGFWAHVLGQPRPLGLQPEPSICTRGHKVVGIMRTRRCRWSSVRADAARSSSRWSPSASEPTLGSQQAGITCVISPPRTEVGRARSLDRTCPPQFDLLRAEILEESGAAAEQDGDEVDLHLVQ